MAEKKYLLKRLSAEFYQDYDVDAYPEIEHKGSRPYMVLLVKIGQNTFALPLRTNNNKEYIEIARKAHSIISSFERYLNGYIRYQANEEREFDKKRYKYTTLKYFHNELGIQNSKL